MTTKDPVPAGRGEWCAACVAMLILADAFDATLYALFDSSTKLAPGLPLSRAPLLVVVIVVGVLLSRDRQGAVQGLRASWALWPAIGLAFLSVGWSDTPATTVFWAIALLVTALFGVALAVRFSPLEQCALIIIATTCVALGSIVVLGLWPSFGFDRADWRGLYIHRNLLGRVAALGLVAAVVGGLSAQRSTLTLRSWFPLLGAVSCATILMRTASRTAQLSALLAMVTIGLVLTARGWRARARVILVGGVIAASLATLFLVSTPTGLALLGRSPTLSERTTIWKGVLANSIDSPWLGRGYAAFWPGPAGQRTVASLNKHFSISHAHNGSVDLFAELGVSGLLLVWLPLTFFVLLAARHALGPDPRACLWPIAYLSFFVVSNLAESAFFRHKIYWALYVAVACHVGAAASNRR